MTVLTALKLSTFDHRSLIKLTSSNMIATLFTWCVYKQIFITIVTSLQHITQCYWKLCLFCNFCLFSGTFIGSYLFSATIAVVRFCLFKGITFTTSHIVSFILVTCGMTVCLEALGFVSTEFFNAVSSNEQINIWTIIKNGLLFTIFFI